ncbi:MAG: hypothetical protein U0R64_01005 [Candidatus Nanopelagicales bacterium]
MSTTTPVDAQAETRTGPGPAAAGAVTGLVAGVAATVTGLVLGLVLNVLGATTTAPLRLGTWLTGLGLGGGWHQVVTSDLPTGAGWTTWVAGAPLLVTAAAGLIAARLFRRYSPGIVGVAMACLTFGIVAAAVVVLSIVTETTTSDSGTVDSSMGLTWLWTGGLRPGTVVGAILLMLVVGLATTVLRPHLDAARGVAWGVVVVPGVVFTVVLLAGVFYLTSQPVAALTVGLLMPLAGTAIMFGLGGARVSLGLTRAAPEPYTLDTWQAGPLVFAAGVAAVLIIAVIVESS